MTTQAAPLPASFHTAVGSSVTGFTHACGTQRTASTGGGSSVVVQIIPRLTNRLEGGTGFQQ